MSRYFLMMLLVIGMLTGLACSNGASNSPTSAPDLTGQFVAPKNHVAWGVFDLNFDLQKGTVEVAWDRTAENHFNVTAKVKPPVCYDCVLVQNPSYDAGTGHFGVDVQLKNPTNFSAYDVRGVISDAGGNKFLANPDGVTTVWGPPMQFKAYNVDGDRKVGPLSTFTRHFDFLLPSGENFKSLVYIIDASVPGQVLEPLAEQGVADDIVNNGDAVGALRISIMDHQGDLASVTADLMPIGGSPSVPLYDDGGHGDGAAGDHVYGINGIKTTFAANLYMINVYPMDAGGHMGWGQIPVNVVKTSGGDNHDPVIKSVTSDRTTANGATEKIKITCTATDQDGDTLNYSFKGTGSFSGQTGGVVNWKPSSSATGAQKIDVSVGDGKGGMATSSITLWSTTLAIIVGNTQGKIPDGTMSTVLPNGSIKMGSDFAGNVVYLNFWATWCGYCVQELPDLEKIYNDNKSNENYTHIFIDLQEGADTVTNFVNGNHYAASYWALDSDGAYFGKCSKLTGNGSGIPQHLLFDRDNKCRWTHVGALSDTSELAKNIKQLL